MELDDPCRRRTATSTNPPMPMACAAVPTFEVAGCAMDSSPCAVSYILKPAQTSAPSPTLRTATSPAVDIHEPEASIFIPYSPPFTSHPTDYSPPFPPLSAEYSLPSAPPKRRPQKVDGTPFHEREIVVRDGFPHPYARLERNKHRTDKRRQMWNLLFDKSIFSAKEIANMGAPHRRTIYIATLESHIDHLHQQLLDMSLVPVPFDQLTPYCGLHATTAKAMVCGLQYDQEQIDLQLLELERTNATLQQTLSGLQSPISPPARAQYYD